MIADEATSKIEEVLWAMLNERFSDDFEFGPIIVIPRLDQDGEEYLHSYIVFQGDQKKLDPAWTLRLSNSLWPHSEALGYPGIPVPLFVERSEWPSLEKSLA